MMVTSGHTSDVYTCQGYVRSHIIWYSHVGAASAKDYSGMLQIHQLNSKGQLQAGSSHPSGLAHEEEEEDEEK